MSNTYRRGKEFERLIARILGGKRRTSQKGQACSDIEGLPWSVEVTRTTQGATAIGKKWKQSVRNARLEKQEPLLIIAEPRQRWKDVLVVCRLELFVNLTKESE